MKRKKAKGTRQLMHLRVDRTLYEIIKQRAEVEDRPLAWVVERVLREHFQPQEGS